jgi:outer membrane lipoprotein-sorting protein
MLVLLIQVPGKLFAQKHITGTAVLENAERVFAPVHDFIVSIEAAVKMERLNVPKMQGTMYFKKPDKLHFTSNGFMMVPREGLAFNPGDLRKKYDVGKMNPDTLDGVLFHRLELRTKDLHSSEHDMIVWVNAADWTIGKMEMMPYDGRHVTIRFTYMLLQGAYNLPARVEILFMSPGVNTAADSALGSQQQMAGMARMAPLSGSAIMTYTNYRINQGIDDSLFQTKTEHGFDTKKK